MGDDTYDFHSSSKIKLNPQSPNFNLQNNFPSNLKNPLKAIPFLQEYIFQENTLVTFLLDASYNLIAFDIAEQIILDINHMIKLCTTYHPKNMILAIKTQDASNDPKLKPLPRRFIDDLHTKLDPLSISLLDYIIFSQDDFFSLRYHDLLCVSNC